MNLIDYLILAIVVAIVGFALLYIRKAKKKGAKCIGCPSGCNCVARESQFSCGSCPGCKEK
jgi:hypothetical protein